MNQTVQICLSCSGSAHSEHLLFWCVYWYLQIMSTSFTVNQVKNCIFKRLLESIIISCMGLATLIKWNRDSVENLPHSGWFAQNFLWMVKTRRVKWKNAKAWIQEWAGKNCPSAGVLAEHKASLWMWGELQCRSWSQPDVGSKTLRSVMVTCAEAVICDF